MEREEKEGGASARLVFSAASRRRLYILSAVLLCGMLLLGISSVFSDYKNAYKNSYENSYEISYKNSDENSDEDYYKNADKGSGGENVADFSDMSAEAVLERRLVSILERIEGAGRVDVRLTFSVGERTEYAVNSNISERQTDENGGSDGGGEQRRVTERTTSETMVLPGNGEPVVVQQSGAKVQGVLVVADGGSDAAVCARISAALQNLLAVPAHKIIICPAGV